MKVSKQAALVRNHLFTEAHLTSWQAEGVYRIRRLASRISELKNAGYEIEKARCTDATGQPYTRYSFSKAQKRTRRPRNAPVQSQRRYTVAELQAGYADYAMKQDYFDERSFAENDAHDFARYMETHA
ncbi:helix-turn-helix domain-containing protein [Lysobacter capsici]|uniref:helix-turn-helix domain-containing protein n=1 Tax=Lysobacter capsici TaxID=435897 RepID=UPI001C000809|nr:helix-turn-helix domain-containing protein [Lysobacter capsici]QWF18721.1 helix-turn-helix domain-containing protein [Lysobacter capsici]